MFSNFRLLFSLAGVFCAALVTSAQPSAFTYQGRLDDAAAPSAGRYEMTFKLFDAATGGAQTGTALTHNIEPSNGVFTVTLDFGSTPFDGSARWLEIALRPANGSDPFTTLAPRQPVTPVPYAISARNLSGPLTSSNFAGTYSNALTLNNPNNQITGTFNGLATGLRGTITNQLAFSPASGAPFTVGNSNRVTNLNADLLDGFDSSAFWKTSGNSGTTPGPHFVGTTDNQPLEFKVNGQRVLRLDAPNGFATPNIIGGYIANIVSFGGGSVIAGGGGPNGESNRISGGYSTISGGALNTVSSQVATIGGGAGNTVSGNYSTVPGGFFNTAQGIRSFAAGNQAKALHDGSFVWSDSVAADFASTAPNQFSVRANGGMRVVGSGGFNNPQLAVTQTSPGDFARIRLQASGPAWDIALSPGSPSSLRFWNGSADNLILEENGSAFLRGTLTQNSDRTVKERVQPVEPRAVLQKVANLSISTWSYTNSPNTRHLGPMAQDFHAAFGLGDSDRGIASVDADGVALAAIQGLNEKLDEQNRALRDELQTKAAELESLKQRLLKLEHLLGSTAPE